MSYVETVERAEHPHLRKVSKAGAFKRYVLGAGQVDLSLVSAGTEPFTVLSFFLHPYCDVEHRMTVFTVQ